MIKRVHALCAILASSAAAMGLFAACASDPANANATDQPAGDAATAGEQDSRDGAAATDATPPDGASPSPPRMQIQAGFNTFCVTTVEGKVGCWGSNERAQFGLGTHSAFRQANPPPATAVPNFSATQLSLKTDHVCAIAGGQVYCWGNNAEDQLGHPASVDLAAGDAGRCIGDTACAKTPVVVDGTAGAKAVSTGVFFSCADLPAGVSCWGRSSYGATGPADGGTPGSPLIRVPLGPVTELHSGNNFSCARLSSDGSIWCWGGNDYGQLGRTDIDAGTIQAYPIPAQVGTITGTKGFALGYLHACAIRADGTVVCWGYNDSDASPNGSGQLGHDPNLDPRCFQNVRCNPEPRPVPGLTNVRQLALGAQHSCALREDGVVLCWGFVDRGALGGFPPDAGQSVVTTPVPVLNLSGVTSIAAAGLTTCAVTERDEVWCWGVNGYGVRGSEPGYGLPPNRVTPF
jgi:alpha-tubulin suppressor-like RCC1 family protein